MTRRNSSLSMRASKATVHRPMSMGSLNGKSSTEGIMRPWPKKTEGWVGGGGGEHKHANAMETLTLAGVEKVEHVL